MQKKRIYKDKLKKISVAILAFGIFFAGSSFAADNPDNLNVRLSDDFLEWSELSTKEKQKTIMPNTYIPDVSDKILSKYEVRKTPFLVSSLLGKTRASLTPNVSATANQSQYSLAEDLDIRVENQGITSECWAFSLIKSMETNIALTNQTRELENFSERHMDYSTSKTFIDGTNENGFNREVTNGGIPIAGLAYLTNGQGAVLESDMPFENNADKIYLNDINKPVDTRVDDYVILPSVIKKYERDGSGNTTSVRYFKSSGEEYTPSELAQARQMIKEHIIKYGGVTTMTGGNLTEFYNNSNPFNASAYNCNVNKTRDHAITIVGWDDNYSRDNFKEGAKPSTDGAYITLNSYGTESFDNGYLYVSYEDVFIEDELYGICATSKINYDKLYQHDFFGGIYQIGSSSVNSGYFATIFEKENTQEEYLNSVGVTIPDYSTLEVYVNPSGTNISLDSLKLVAAPSTVFSPGYHTINFDEVEVYGTEFAVVVKQTSTSGQFYFSVETSIEGSLYSDVKSSNLSYYSLTGDKWNKLTDTKIDGINLKNADVCIKAFTNLKSENPNNPVEPDDPTPPDNPTQPDNPSNPNNPSNPTEPDTPGTQEPDNPVQPDNPSNPEEPEVDIFKSDIYKIGDLDIMNIDSETNIQTFLNNITTNLDISFMDNDVRIENKNQTIKTGMKLILPNNKEYTLIVRGDTNSDGRLSLMDISRLILHYNEAPGYELTGIAKKGADMNCDSIINLVDVSQMIYTYNLK